MGGFMMVLVVVVVLGVVVDGWMGMVGRMV